MMPRIIKQYDLLEMIGEGGTGSVYKAIDMNRGKVVALKILHSDLIDKPQILDQLQFEANQYLYLNHINIVKLEDFDLSNQPFLVMEYVDGNTYEEKINNITGPIVENSVVNAMLQLLDALSYVHGKGLLHLDIKPANIMVDKNNTIKILDFGISRSVNNQNINGTQGTPFYMSPEQVMNKHVDERTDIYGAGITMYKMLCGKLPFQNSIEQQELSSRIVNGDFIPIKQNYPLVSDAAQQIVNIAMSTDPSRRFSSALEFKNTLITLL
jgi:serine/threonine protein kinase